MMRLLEVVSIALKYLKLPLALTLTLSNTPTSNKIIEMEYLL